MPALKIALQLRSLRQPLRTALVTAAKLGVHAIEIDARTELRPVELTQTALRQLRKLLDDLNLRVAAISFRTRRGYDAEEALDRRVEATKDALRMAHSLGAPYVLNALGKAPTDAEDPRRGLLLDVLGDLAAYGNRVGAMLAAETVNDAPADLAALLDLLPAGSLAVALEPASLVLQGFTIDDAISHLGTRIQYVTARDAVRERTAIRGQEVALGRGSVDFPNLLGELEQRDYRGYFTVARDQALDPVRELGAAIEYLQNL